MPNIINPSKGLELLSSMYLCKPSPGAMTAWMSLLDEETSCSWQELKGALEGIDAASETVLEDLLWDYTRLFIGPYRLPCPPWESVYTSQKKLMMQDAADAAKRAYAEIGLTIDDPTIMPDHIGAELSFLSLAYMEAGGEKFLHSHLLNWVPQFTRDMENAAETNFYKALARKTRHMLEMISERTTSLRPDTC